MTAATPLTKAQLAEAVSEGMSSIGMSLGLRLTEALFGEQYVKAGTCTFIGRTADDRDIEFTIEVVQAEESLYPESDWDALDDEDQAP